LLMGEDDDYLSSLILKEAEEFDRNNKKKIKKFKRKPPSSSNHVSIEDGLSKAIPEDNIGYKLLQKMGFQDGSGLGKNSQGTSEPLPLFIKRGRYGLGEKREREDMDKIERIVKKPRIEKIMVSEYKSRVNKKFSTKKSIERIRDIVSKVCPNLDETYDIKENELLIPFKPYMKEDPELNETKEGENSMSLTEYIESIDEEERENILISLLEYLRSTHFYCFFCGTKYTDKDDLEGNCPGESEDKH